MQFPDQIFGNLTASGDTAFAE